MIDFGIATATRVACLLAALAPACGVAATVRLDNVSHDSAPGYEVSASGTDRFGQTASGHADETAAEVQGRLVGPNWPPFLTAGLDVFADTRTGGLLGTSYTVQGVRAGADLTFVWRLSGDYSGVADRQSLRVEAAWGLYNGRQLFGGRFDGLSFIDTTPAAGDFAGRLEGSLICRDNGSLHADDCGTDWNGLGERFVSVRDNQSSGQLAANIRIGGSGEDTRAQYRIELVEVLVAVEDLLAEAVPVRDEPAQLRSFLPLAAGPEPVAGLAAAAGPPAAFLQFASGRTLGLTAVGAPQSVPLPPAGALLVLGLALLAAQRRVAKRAGQPGSHCATSCAPS